MPRNGSGAMVRIHDWTADANAAINIRADRMDGDTDDIAAEITNSIARDGQSVPTANLPMGGYKFTGVGYPTSAGEVLILGARYANFGVITPYADADNAKYVNAGYGSAWAVTPSRSGRVRIRVTGMLIESSSSGAAEIKGIYYGTGAAPAQGAALAGTNINTNSIIFAPLVANAKTPFAIEAEISGLTLSTAHWFDLGVGAVGAGTATFSVTSVVIEEF